MNYCAISITIYSSKVLIFIRIWTFVEVLDYVFVQIYYYNPYFMVCEYVSKIKDFFSASIIVDYLLFYLFSSGLRLCLLYSSNLNYQGCPNIFQTDPLCMFTCEVNIFKWPAILHDIPEPLKLNANG